MFRPPIRPEINNYTIKLIIGFIALSLAFLTWFFSGTDIQSISASYYEGGWARDILVGFLFSISAFLLAYNGRSGEEMVSSKLAAIAAMGVAMFPCKCGNHPQVIPYVHGISAAVMFLLLAFFCYQFFRRAKDKGDPQARRRAFVYAVCGAVIVTSILTLTIDHLSGGVLSARIDRLTFFGEAAGLVSFGIAWISASHCLPIITSKRERDEDSPFSRYSASRTVEAG